MIYNAIDNKLHTLKKRLSAAASYSKNNNFFLSVPSPAGSYGLMPRKILDRANCQNADQQRVWRQKALSQIL